MMDYLLHSGTPVHLSRAVRRAWELERTAHQHGRLRDRILDPRAVELLGDLDVIGAFLALIATETMPTNEGSALHRGTSVYRLNINLGRPLVSAGVPSWHELGPSSSVVQCLDELYHGRESDLLKPAIVASWAQEYEKLKANYGEGLREYLQEALSAMQMHTSDASDRRLVDDLKLIATMLPQTSLSM